MKPGHAGTSTTTMLDSFGFLFPSTVATLVYSPVVVSLCSHVNVVYAPTASSPAPPPMFVHFGSLKCSIFSVMLPVFVTMIS